MPANTRNAVSGSDVAKWLEMRQSTLERYVDEHTNPTVEVLETTAGTTLNDDQSKAVETWLEMYQLRQEEKRKNHEQVGGDPRGLLYFSD